MIDRSRLPSGLSALLCCWIVAALVDASLARAIGARDRASTASAEGYIHAETWSASGRLPDLVQPIDLALADDGRLFVADGRSGQVLVFRDPDPRPVEIWEAPPALADRPGTVVPRALEIDRARAQVGLVWQMGTERFVEIRTLGGTPVAGPWRAPAPEAPDIAFDPESGEILMPAPDTCRLYRLRPADGYLVARLSLADLGCEALHIAALPGARAVIQVENGVHLVDLGIDDASAVRVGGFGLAGDRPLDVAVDARSRVHLLVRTPPVRQPPSDAMLLIFGSDRSLERSIAAADLGLPPVPWNSEWPWALDVAASGLALTTAAERFQAGVRALDGGPGWTLTGEETLRSYEPPVPGGEPGAGDAGAMSLAMAPDQRLVMLDESLPVLVAFASDGRPDVWTKRPAGAREVAVAADGTSYATTALNTVLRFGPTLDWIQPCDCGYGGGQIVAARDRVFVGRPRHQAVAQFEAATGRELGSVERLGAGAIGWWPADLAIEGDRLIAADMAGSRLAAWSLAGGWQADWPAGVFDGPYRTAAGWTADGRAVIAALLTDGYIELYAASSGQLVERWLPRLGDGSAIEIADLAMDRGGRIFLADAARRVVQVFEPREMVPPSPGTPSSGPSQTVPPSETPAPTPSPSGATCRMSGEKVVGPRQVRLGETARITLTLRTDCPVQSRAAGADILLLMDISSSMTGDAFTAAQSAAVTFVLNTDPAAHRVGLIAFSDWALPTQPLTADLGRVVAQLEGLRVVQDDGATDLKPALELADRWLGEQLRPGAQAVVILLTDGQYEGAPDPQPAAAALRARGADIYAIGLGGADQDTLLGIAGRPDRYFDAPRPADLAPIYRAIRRLVAAKATGQVLIDDRMGEHIALVPASADPPAVEGVDRLRWGFSALPISGITLTYTIRPELPGRWSANRSAVADYVDGDGRPGRFEFPVPLIEVVDAGPTAAVSATPTAPSPAATPSATPSPIPNRSATPRPSASPPSPPTRTPRPTAQARAVYLPLVRRDSPCAVRRRPIEVALVLDASSSMLGTAGGGETKLAAAVRAAEIFLLQLDPATDRVAVISFNHEARVVQGLTGDRARIRAALGRITTATETRIDLGIERAHGVLLGSPRWASAASAMIVLTDGRANPVPVDIAVARALAARRDGITLFAIGLGADLDLEALERMASRPDYFHRAADAGDLVDIYRAIAVQLPCVVGR